MATISITVNDCAACPNPPTAGFSYASPFCVGVGTASITLDAGATAGLFTANPAGLSINATTGEVDLVASTAGTYTVTNTVAASGACPQATATANISINSLPTADAGIDQSICQGDNVTLTASGGTNYQWSDGAGNTASISINPVATTTYTVTVSDAAACSATDDVTVIVNNAADAGADNSATVCDNSGEGSSAIDLSTPRQRGGRCVCSIGGAPALGQVQPLTEKDCLQGNYEYSYTVAALPLVLMMWLPSVLL
ncbi:MAG: hypothetical protein IPL33_18885 [Sphingobacteriales bacterium]|nr:hypothetical protein [Sphingobacteriales bacterium]